MIFFSNYQESLASKISLIWILRNSFCPKIINQPGKVTLVGLENAIKTFQSVHNATRIHMVLPFENPN